ncbi:hypothetical protein H5410_007977 [Solanum commersonii]|uniref:Uncharacterized protein n=1 Tax=Solanum commersonii TaxID=4109 RepID=A0A9J6AFJ6_SOLCO|nr:hypothetical protein H5410_007977 [Solanum commersonii]
MDGLMTYAHHMFDYLLIRLSSFNLYASNYVAFNGSQKQNFKSSMWNTTVYATSSCG